MSEYYLGYNETVDDNPTIKILCSFSSKSYSSAKELSDAIIERASSNVNRWIEFNNSSDSLLKSQLIYLLNNTFKQFIINKKLCNYNGEIKQYIDIDKALSMLDNIFSEKISNIGIENFVDTVLILGVNSIRGMLKTISVLHIISNVDCKSCIDNSIVSQASTNIISPSVKNVINMFCNSSSGVMGMGGFIPSDNPTFCNSLHHLDDNIKVKKVLEYICRGYNYFLKNNIQLESKLSLGIIEYNNCLREYINFMKLSSYVNNQIKYRGIDNYISILLSLRDGNELASIFNSANMLYMYQEEWREY